MDKDGRVTDIITEEYDESHQLIEECMLAANEAVALTLKNRNRPTIYRVHEEPDSAKLFEFGQLCKLYGHPVHDIGQRQYLNELMKSIKGSPDEQLLKLALLKSLMRARYDTEPLGHYGLATANYCHFTSPHPPLRGPGGSPLPESPAGQSPQGGQRRRQRRQAGGGRGTHFRDGAHFRQCGKGRQPDEAFRMAGRPVLCGPSGSATRP